MQEVELQVTQFAEQLTQLPETKLYPVRQLVQLILLQVKQLAGKEGHVLQ
jgi:hypothetical protein